MLNRLTVRNFKRFGEVSVELDSPVLFVGPNDSGKTTALQALALWDLGMRRWNEKRAGSEVPVARPGVTVNRRDLLAVPMANAKQIWRNLRVRHVRREGKKQRTGNIRIDILVSGDTRGAPWQAGFEFDYANEESFYCRPLRVNPDGSERMPVPAEAAETRIAYLPPMSGLAANELRIDPGGVEVRIGEGRTAEVLRNLCFRIFREQPERWETLVAEMERMFGARLDPPEHIAARGEIAMSFWKDGARFDLTASGRGFQQTMLLLAHLALNPGAVLLLDEPDAHLEIVRQREIYRLLRRAADAAGSQIIAASHSEVLLHEAAGNDTIIAFVGEPHRIADRGSQVLKALRDIGYGDYEQARRAGFVLYLEGASDLSVLRAFAERLGRKRALDALDSAFVHPVGNQPAKAMHHYHGLREAVPELRGLALFDRLRRALPEMRLPAFTWSRREIENYLCSEATLFAWAGAAGRVPEAPDLFAPKNGPSRREAMAEAIRSVRRAAAVLRPGVDPAGPDAKVSEDFLEPLFAKFFSLLGEVNRMPKRRFHELVRHLPQGEIDAEVPAMLDRIAAAHAARRRSRPVE